MRICLRLPILHLLAALSMLWPASASADYRLQPGDSLAMFVVGLPELEQTAQINLDGDVVFPVLGTLRAGGRTLSEVQEEVSQRIASKTAFSLGNDGIRTIFLDPTQVTISVASYQPIYVRGDVTKPGEQPFRPGLSVRQAIAVAGGYDLLRFRDGNPFMDAAKLRGEYDQLWIEFANAQIRVKRLEAELAGNGELGDQTVAGAPVSAELLRQIVKAEQEQLRLSLQDHEEEGRHLGRAVGISEETASLLGEQQQKEKADMDADAEDLKRVQGLFEKGTLAVTRVTDARQALLTSSVRYLDTSAELSIARQTLEDAKREIDRAESTWRLELLSDLQEARAALETARSKLRATSEQLLYIGTDRSQLTQGLAGEPSIMIFARGDETEGRSARESDILAPGDLVEVTLQPPAEPAELMQ
jgi:polysaccharide export outer membrane protein